MIIAKIADATGSSTDKSYPSWYRQMPLITALVCASGRSMSIAAQLLYIKNVCFSLMPITRYLTP